MLGLEVRRALVGYQIPLAIKRGYHMHYSTRDGAQLEHSICDTQGGYVLAPMARGVRLTPAGESLLHHARSMMFSLEKMQAELSEYADGVRGHVRMHASISAIVQFLPEDLGGFIRAHDAIKIDLEEHLSTEVLRAVQEGAADIGIFPFVRQFAAIDPAWFDHLPLGQVKRWLAHWLQSPLFSACMAKLPANLPTRFAHPSRL